MGSIWDHNYPVHGLGVPFGAVCISRKIEHSIQFWWICRASAPFFIDQSCYISFAILCVDFLHLCDNSFSACSPGKYRMNKSIKKNCTSTANPTKCTLHHGTVIYVLRTVIVKCDNSNLNWNSMISCVSISTQTCFGGSWNRNMVIISSSSWLTIKLQSVEHITCPEIRPPKF